MENLTMYAVRTWIQTVATGDFHYKQVLDGLVLPSSHAKLREYVRRCCEEQVCEPLGRKDGWYRPITELPQPVEWVNVPARVEFPIILPFELRKYVFIYPNTVTIVAGSKSAGKTGFLYNTLALNAGAMNIILLTNMEGGKEQLRDRLYALELKTTDHFKVFEVNDNFHDFIKEPDTLYLIDYIDAPEGTDFYLIGAAVSKVRKKLFGNSHAIIGLQKPRGRDTAFGGEGTLKDATLYLAMDSNKLKIVDAKVPANPKIIPKNMTWTFSYKDEGTSFFNILPVYGEE